MQDLVTAKSKFHGDLDSGMTLTDVFETLGARNKSGWLLLKSANGEISLYVKKDNVGLVSMPELGRYYLAEKLYYAGKISDDIYRQCQNQSPDEWQELVPSEDLYKILATISYDEICKLFLWQQGSFCFVDEESMKGSSVRYPRAGMFPISSLLIEAAQRIDELPGIRSRLPGEQEILVHNITPERLPPKDQPLGNIWHLADHRSVKNIIEFSCFSKFDGSKILSSLCAEDQLRKLSDAELSEYAGQSQDHKDFVGAEGYYRLLLQRRPDDLATAECLADCCRHSQNHQAVAEIYRQVATSLLKKDDKENKIEGARYLKKYCRLQPRNEAMAERCQLLYLLLHENIDPAGIDYDPIGEGVEFFNALKDAKKDETACDVLKAILIFAPERIDLRQSLIDISLHLNNYQEVIAQYQEIATTYERQGKHNKLAAIYRKMLVFAPKRSDIIEKLQCLDERRRRQKICIIQVVAVTACILLLIFLNISYRRYINRQQRQKQVAKERIENYLDQAKPKQARAFFTANDSLFTVAEKTAISEKILLKFKELDQHSILLLMRARDAIADGRFSLALQILQQAADMPHSDSIAEAIQNKKRNIQNLLQKFAIKMDKAKRLEQAGKFGAATYIYCEIWQDPLFKNIERRKTIELPLTFTISPPGATLQIDERTYQFDQPEKVLRCPPDFQNITISLLGYAKQRYYNAFYVRTPENIIDKYGQKLEPLQQSCLKVKLEKTFYWSFPLGAAVEGGICHAEGTLYIACRDSHLYAFGNLSGFPGLKWKKQIAPFANFCSGPVYYKGVLYIGGNDGYFYAINARSSKIMARYQVAGLSPVKASPAILPGKRLVIFGAQNGKVYALPLVQNYSEQWQPKWSFSTGKAVVSTPVSASNLIIFGSEDSLLYAINLGNGKMAWTYQAGFPIYCAPALAKDVLYLGVYGYFFALDAGQGSLIWQNSKIDGAVYGTPVVDKNRIYCVTYNRRLHAFSMEGKILWTFKTLGVIKASPIVNQNGIVYLGCQKGWLYAIDSHHGELIWKYELGHPVVSPPILANGKIFVVTKKLYALIDD